MDTSATYHPHLFEGYGIESEYMLASRFSYDIMPIAHEFLADPGAGEELDVEPVIVWSNELVSHVVEAKCARPAPTIESLHKPWRAAIADAVKRLARYDAILLPSAAHPWMDPRTETHIWTHQGREIYAEYDRIFGCRTHGWANLQSTHLNLPFAGDDEFARLHAAVRVALPLIPAIAAASPYLDGVHSGFLDARMNAYLTNSMRIPAMTGPLIPEPIYSEAAYRSQILNMIYDQAAPLDPRGILRDEWANARAAIARFDRMSIEIRAVDSQESVVADLALASAIATVVRLLVEEKFAAIGTLKKWDTTRLREIFLATTRDAENSVIGDQGYAAIFGLKPSNSMGSIWRGLLESSDFRSPLFDGVYENYCRRGSLASRLLRRTGYSPTRKQLLANLRDLGDCLESDSLLIL